MELGLTLSLSESLKNETRVLHAQAERSTFMHALLRGEMQRGAYCAMLRNLHVIYAALEPALARHAGDPRLSPIHLSGLAREATLRSDLDALHGPGWREACAVQGAALRYADRLHALDHSHPELLAAHSYVRYLGDLSGGQILARIVRDSLSLAPGFGTAFYEFGDAAETAHLKRAFREGLDALPADAATADALVQEAKLAFELHRQLFDELACGELSR